MNLNYTKTLLYAYPHIKAIEEQIDDLVMRKALSSMTDFSPCEEQCEKIIELTEQKKTMIDFYLRMQKVINKTTEYQRDCLDYKYFKQRPKSYYKDFDCTSRGYFRRQVSLVSRIAKFMEKAGLNDKWFEEHCLKISFFYELLRRVVSMEKRQQKKQNKSIQSVSIQCEKLSA